MEKKGQKGHENLEKGNINLNLDTFLITTIKGLGQSDSLDADLINILMVFIKIKVQKINKQFLTIHKYYLTKQDRVFALEGEKTDLDIKPLKSKKIDLLQKEKKDFLEYFHLLQDRKRKIDEIKQRFQRIFERIPALSLILSSQLPNSPKEEIEEKLKTLFQKKYENLNPLLYEKLRI